MPRNNVLKSIKKSFTLPLGEMQRIIRDFSAEMTEGLSGRKSSLKMIPTYVDKPTGEERGSFIALDVGGTNFRVLALELKGKGRVAISAARTFVIDKKYIVGEGRRLFDFLADCIKAFLKGEGQAVGGKDLAMGFTFSFPIDQMAAASGRLLHWTKGFRAAGVVGKDVVELLNGALTRKAVPGVKIAALVNDTVGTLAATAYKDSACDVGIIIGTGTNACYREVLTKVHKWHGPQTFTGHMIINTEWGNFDKLRLTPYDMELDASSENPKRQILEKMVSGMYLGEVARLVIMDLIEKKALFGGISPPIFNSRMAFKAEYMSEMEGDKTADLSRTRLLLERFGIKRSRHIDRKIIKRVCGVVSTRGARTAAAAMAAILLKIDPDLSGMHTIAIDGSVYEKHPAFSESMKIALKELFGKKSSRIKVVLSKDGSGLGAAIIAAVAANQY